MILVIAMDFVSRFFRDICIEVLVRVMIGTQR